MNECVARIHRIKYSKSYIQQTHFIRLSSGHYHQLSVVCQGKFIANTFTRSATIICITLKIIKIQHILVQRCICTVGFEMRKNRTILIQQNDQHKIYFQKQIFTLIYVFDRLNERLLSTRMLLDSGVAELRVDFMDMQLKPSLVQGS